MKQYAIAIDITRCDGCGSCFLACKDEYTGNDYPPYSVAQPNHGHKWMNLREVEQGTGSKVKMDYIPILCQHCENPVCAEGAPEGAVYTRPDGIVILDPVKSKGRKDMVEKCPYGAIYWNEALGVPQKCTLCAHMLDAGEKTVRCVESCPTQALHFGDVNDPNSDISKYLAAKKGHVEDLNPEFGTKPRIRYIDLPKPFIAGEAVLSDKPGEPAEGVKVTLTEVESGKALETETDFLSDFEFKALAAGKNYKLRLEKEGYLPEERSLCLTQAVNTGEIVLKRK